MLTQRTLLIALFTCRTVIKPSNSDVDIKACDGYITTVLPDPDITKVLWLIQKSSICKKAFLGTFQKQFSVPLSVKQEEHFNRIGALCHILRRLGSINLPLPLLPEIILYGAQLIGVDTTLFAWVANPGSKRKIGKAISLVDSESITFKMEKTPLLVADVKKAQAQISNANKREQEDET